MTRQPAIRVSRLQYLPPVLLATLPLLLCALFLRLHDIQQAWEQFSLLEAVSRVNRSGAMLQPILTESTPWVPLEFPGHARERPASLASAADPQDHLLLASNALFNEFRFSASHKLQGHSASGAPGLQLPLVSRTGQLTLARASAGADKTYTLVLDPGHGGTDPGTVGHNGLLEKILTLEIANRVRDLLRSHPGIQVKLTRETDRGFSRDNRVRHIQAADGDLLVSLHLNNLPQQDLTVVETFYAERDNIIESDLEREAVHEASANQRNGMVKVAGNPLPDYTFTRNSKKIAQLLQRNIFREVARNNPSAVDNGVKTDTLYTLTRSRIPAALIELTCLSNKSEEQRLKSADYRQKISVSIAEALIEYFASLDAPQSI